MIVEALVAETREEGVYKTLEIHELSRGRFQPRQHFDQRALQELSDSIKQQGIIQAIVVRPLERGYEIVAGERRWRAAQLAGLHKVPCVIRNIDDQTALAFAIMENMARRSLNAIEEAKAISRLIQEFDYTHEEAAGKLGVSRAEVTNKLRLLNLDDRVQRLIIERDLTETHGRLLAGIPTASQYALAREAVVKAWSHRLLEKAIKQLQLDKKSSSSHTNNQADINRLARLLSDHFCSETKLDLEGGGKGWLKIRFNSNDELAGILEKAGYKDE